MRPALVVRRAAALSVCGRYRYSLTRHWSPDVFNGEAERRVRYAWRLEDVRRVREPIPFVGKQGFFDVPDELIAGALR